MKAGVAETDEESPGEEMTEGVAVGEFEDVIEADGDDSEPTEGVTDAELDELAPGLNVGVIEVETEGITELLTEVEGELDEIAPGLRVGVIEVETDGLTDGVADVEGELDELGLNVGVIEE